MEFQRLNWKEQILHLIYYHQQLAKLLHVYTRKHKAYKNLERGGGNWKGYIPKPKGKES